MLIAILIAVWFITSWGIYTIGFDRGYRTGWTRGVRQRRY